MLWLLELQIRRGRKVQTKVHAVQYIVTAELQTASVAYFERKIQLSGFSANPDGSLSQLIWINGDLLYNKRLQWASHIVRMDNRRIPIMTGWKIQWKTCRKTTTEMGRK